MNRKTVEKYAFDEKRWAQQILDIPDESAFAKQIERMGHNLSDQKKRAREILGETENDIPIDNATSYSNEYPIQVSELPRRQNA